MLVLVATIMGVANFAMHRALVESDHPLLARARVAYQRVLGRHGSYLLEFLVLVCGLAFAARGSVGGTLLYALYTGTNAGGLWMLTRR